MRRNGRRGEADGRESQGRRGAARLVAAIGMLVSIAIMAVPVMTDWMFALDASETIDGMTSVYDEMSDDDRTESLLQARAFNARLSGMEAWEDSLDSGTSEPIVPSEVWDYDRQLTYHGTPQAMMSHIDIPSIGIRLPIYHHVSNSVLSAGVGHLEGTSLPVGGKSTRCVLMAHSGMERTRMFDDIRHLGIGDEFVLWTLGKPYAYRVCDIRTILPDELGGIGIEPDQDLCTLVTCTPFGVNTHRLLVTGERCAYDGSQGFGAPGVQAYVNRRTAPMLAGISAATLILLVGAVAGLVGRRGKRRESRPDGARRLGGDR